MPLITFSNLPICYNQKSYRESTPTTISRIKGNCQFFACLTTTPKKIKIQAYLRKLSKTDQSRAHVSDLHAPNPHAITKCRSSPLLMAASNSARLGIKKTRSHLLLQPISIWCSPCKSTQGF